MATATRLHFEEWCPSCGSGVDTLDPRTGWCKTCTGNTTTGLELDLSFVTTCVDCGKRFTAYQNSRSTCLSCRNVQWLNRNADSIERVMVHYEITVVEAIIKVSDDNRPRCAMCGDKIKHGTRGRTIFCTKREPCRRAGIRYTNYRKRNNMSDDDALQKALYGKGPRP